MTKLRILLLIVSLLIPSFVFAQTAVANKTWNAFWRQFSAAVNKKDKVAVKRLMAAEKYFFSGGGIEDRNGWLRLVDKNNWWGDLQISVKGGTKPHQSDGRPSRITKDEQLVFAFIGGRWRFVGPMGD